ncbi:hypothetical protein CEXT_487451 [Caerostris extrusa]|uniref:Uncharacterized protein n=1 Tax=Caerostris extrusa TaxID=172846 RepID=A0AAV4Y0B8_CAEEX|nr:hypothetical protein CEXT_487451 [Caerostris extrusa]
MVSRDTTSLNQIPTLYLILETEKDREDIEALKWTSQSALPQNETLQRCQEERNDHGGDFELIGFTLNSNQMVLISVNGSLGDRNDRQTVSRVCETF